MGDGQWFPERTKEEREQDEQRYREEKRINELHKKNVCEFLKSVDADTVNKLKIIKNQYKEYEQLTYTTERDIKMKINLLEEEMVMVRNSINETNKELKKISDSKVTAFFTTESTIANLKSDQKSLTDELIRLENQVKRLNEKSINIKNANSFVDNLFQAYRNYLGINTNTNKLYISDFYSYLDNCKVVNTNDTLIKNKYLKYKQKYLNLKNKLN